MRPIIWALSECYMGSSKLNQKIYKPLVLSIIRIQIQSDVKPPLCTMPIVCFCKKSKYHVYCVFTYKTVVLSVYPTVFHNDKTNLSSQIEYFSGKSRVYDFIWILNICANMLMECYRIENFNVV